MFLKHQIIPIFLIGALEIHLREYECCEKMSKNGLQTEDDPVLYSFPSLSLQIHVHSNHVPCCLSACLFFPGPQAK